jgi:hypothetical protein
MTQQFGEPANWGWHILKLAFRPGSASHYHTAVNLQGEHDEERCPECEAEKFEIRLTRLEQRWGHGGASRLPVARRPYARRKRPRQLHFVEDAILWSSEDLDAVGVAQVQVQVAHHAGRTRRYWICPQCGNWAVRLFQMDKVPGVNPELPCVGCRRCAGLAYHSQYEGGKALITPERIQAAAAHGPRSRRKTSPARLHYEMCLLLAEKQLQERTRTWERHWEAAMDLWLMSHLVSAVRMQMRLVRLQLAELKAAQAPLVERQAACDELAKWRERKQVAQAQFEQAQTAYERVAAA